MVHLLSRFLQLNIKQLRSFKMGRRAVSPAPSDAEADIVDSLFTEDINGSKPNQAAVDEGFDFLDDGPDGAEDDDGDEAFIALKQAASYRKTSQMKSKSAKKSGGGFQTMGTMAPYPESLHRAMLTDIQD